MQHNVPFAADADESRQAPITGLWKLADRFRAGADRIDDAAAETRHPRSGRLLWQLADRFRAGADRIDDLAADFSRGGRWAW